jgi:hypothetical protein
MLLRRDDHPEMSVATFLFGLHQDAGGVGAQIRGPPRVEPHRLDDGTSERRRLGVPAAHRRPRQLEALARIDLLEPVERQVILPAPDDGVGDQARPRQAACDGQLGHRRDGDLGLGAALAIFAHELGTAHAHDDERAWAALDGLADVFADALEGVETLALHVVGQDLDFDARQSLGSGLRPVGCCRSCSRTGCA